MDNTAREVFCEAVVPVIMDNGCAAHAKALGASLKHGLSSVLCGKRKNLLDLLNIGSGFLSLSGERGRLTLEQLLDFADTWNESILVLVPMSDADRKFIEENRESIESRYIVSTDGRLDSLPIKNLERGGRLG